VAITSVLFAGAALARAVWIGAAWRFEGVSNIPGVLLGLPVAFLLMAGEELACRGYGFRHLIAAVGARTALVVSALAFGVNHLALTGFGMWGIGAFWVAALPALDGIILGLAMIRTGGLALPLSVLRLDDMKVIRDVYTRYVAERALGMPETPPASLYITHRVSTLCWR
jgi:membrane protease YdiL (CAAX protease family)